MPTGPTLVYEALSFPLPNLRNLVGRRNVETGLLPTVDCAPFDRDRVVSRRHAEIAYRDGDLVLIDLGARNGLFVNGERLRANGERTLKDGDALSFGGVAMKFEANHDWPEGLYPEWSVADTSNWLRDTTVASSGTPTGQLQDAITRRALVLHYQPKVELATGELEAVECLIRWQPPNAAKLIYPDQFLPLAEQTGLIKGITRWVLEEALRQCTEWRAMGLAIPVAVNISTRDLDDADFADHVAELIASNGATPSDLVIEITETGVMSNAERSIKNLERLKAKQVKLSIDDFGIGHSSLAYLKQLPADELKIDKLFSMSMDPHNLAILKSAINVGHDLGMRVTAEGVETQAALDALKGLGCDVGQGYFFGRPVSAEAFASSPLARRAAGKPIPKFSTNPPPPRSPSKKG